MRVTIRCKDATVLVSDNDEVAVVLNGVNEDDVFGAASIIREMSRLEMEDMKMVGMDEFFEKIKGGKDGD